MHDLSLPSLEDSFYAREAVEMWRAGRLFTVTWNNIPTHQHPPLQHLLLGRSFALFGENDFAARLPTVLMAIGILVATYRIGCQTVGHSAAVTGVALLLVTPFFVDNARGCMMEIPLTFWITTTVVLYYEGLRRPWAHLLLALPLGAGILTKSVLGLMPLLALGGMVGSAELRRPLRGLWIWLGVLLGLGLGAAWPLHQALTQGGEALKAHYLGHVLARSTRELDVVQALLRYPLILLKFYQPVILPGLVGALLLLRRSGLRCHRAAVLVSWIFVPLVLYSFSSFRTPRFVFPILPPLALCAGYWLSEKLPRIASLLAIRLVPLVALATAAVFWTSPALLTRDTNGTFKRNATTLRAQLPESESLPYLGRHYWSLASPLLYYAERQLARSSASAEDAIRVARSRPSRLLMCARNRLAEVLQQGVPHEIVLEDRDWVLLRLTSGQEARADSFSDQG